MEEALFFSRAKKLSTNFLGTGEKSHCVSLENGIADMDGAVALGSHLKAVGAGKAQRLLSHLCHQAVLLSGVYMSVSLAVNAEYHRIVSQIFHG